MNQLDAQVTRDVQRAVAIVSCAIPLRTAAPLEETEEVMRLRTIMLPVVFEKITGTRG